MVVRGDTEGSRSHVVRVGGALDWEQSTAFVLQVARAVDAAVSAHADQLDVDLSGVDLVDTAGLRALIEGKRHAGEAGLRFRLVDVPPGVLRVIEMAALSRFFGLPPLRERRAGR